VAKEKAEEIKAEELKQAPAVQVPKPGPANEEVLHQDVLAILKNVTPDQLVTVTHDPEVVKGTAYRPAAWFHGPATIQLMAVAVRRLNKLAGLQGKSNRQVEKVQPTLIKGTRLLVLKPAPAEDMTAIPVVRYSGASNVWINLMTLLGPEGVTVETHWKELHPVVWVPKESPLHPGLLIDLGAQPKARRSTAPKKGPAE
jgi:hypothetical protein